MSILRTRILFLLLLGLSLTACIPNIVPTLHPTLTSTLTPILWTPTTTLTPTATKTLTPTLTKAPTPTSTSEYLLLEESGYDIANVQISYPRKDILRVDFVYRLEDGISEAKIALNLPTNCRGGPWNTLFDFPFTSVYHSMESAWIEYKLPFEGECVHDSLYLDIWSLIPVSATRSNIGDIVYEEKVNVPYKIVRDFPEISSRVLSLDNFRFEETGNWSGNIIFDYDLSEEIPLENEKYYFSIRGYDGGKACMLRQAGPNIIEYSGSYVINVMLPYDIFGENDCTQTFDSYLFNSFYLYMIDDAVDDITKRTVYFDKPSFEARFVKNTELAQDEVQYTGDLEIGPLGEEPQSDDETKFWNVVLHQSENDRSKYAVTFDYQLANDIPYYISICTRPQRGRRDLGSTRNPSRIRHWEKRDTGVAKAILSDASPILMFDRLIIYILTAPDNPPEGSYTAINVYEEAFDLPVPVFLTLEDIPTPTATRTIPK